MNTTKTLRNLFTLAFCLFLGTLAAQAQATRTWVSGVGDDVNPCSRTAPCKTFAGAISKTAAGGEINVLDAGGFGAVTITKSITIDGGGSFASILASGTNGIIINAAITDVVNIRNLSINGANTGLDGIRYLAASKVNVENCTIFNFTGQGIDTSLTSSGALKVFNTTFEKCNDGVIATTTAGVLSVSLDHVHMQGLTNFGLSMLIGQAAVSSSDFDKIGTTAINGQGPSTINVDSCILTHNGTAISATSAGQSLIRLSNNSIYDNNVGINSIGVVTTAGNNRNAGNTSPGAPNGGLITVQ
jgi:hypothetical protein